jgi:hypothetical protein
MAILDLLNVAWIKTESVYKTDSIPTGAANAILLKGKPKLTPLKANWAERNNAKAYFGKNQKLLASVNRSVSFQVELGGAGSPLGVAAPYSHLLKACGHNQVIVATTSVAHSPVTQTVDSVTIYFWDGDKKYIMVGARGTVKFMYPAGELPYMEFEFEGLLPATNDVVDDATYGGAIVLTAWKQPFAVNFANTTAFSLHGFAAAELYSLEIDAGVKTLYRNKPGVEDVTVVGRDPTATVKIAEPTLAQKNYYTLMKGATLDVMSITHGVGAGNIITQSAPKVQVMDVTVGATDGLRTLDIKLDLLPNAGNDDHLTLLT